MPRPDPESHSKQESRLVFTRFEILELEGREWILELEWMECALIWLFSIVGQGEDSELL